VENYNIVENERAKLYYKFYLIHMINSSLT